MYYQYYCFNVSGQVIMAKNYRQFRKKLRTKLEDKLAAMKKAVRLLQTSDDKADFSLYNTVRYELTFFLMSIIQDDLYVRMFFGIGGYKSHEVLFSTLIDNFCAETFCVCNSTKQFRN
jgi:hypothetical protein